MFYKITNQYVSKVSQKNKGILSNYQGLPGGSKVKASSKEDRKGGRERRKRKKTKTNGRI